MLLLPFPPGAPFGALAVGAAADAAAVAPSRRQSFNPMAVQKNGRRRVERAAPKSGMAGAQNRAAEVQEKAKFILRSGTCTGTLHVPVPYDSVHVDLYRYMYRGVLPVQ